MAMRWRSMYKNRKDGRQMTLGQTANYASVSTCYYPPPENLYILHNCGK